MSLGIDVVDIERFRAALARAPSLQRRLFSDAERGYSAAKPDPVMHLAGTLAAKEAVIKALRLGRLVEWAGRIEVTRDADGVPVASVELDDACIGVEISISHERHTAVAVASRPPQIRGGSDGFSTGS